MAFRVLGTTEKTPVLWVHGGPGSSSCSYVDNLTALATSRPVVLYDQLGTGYSDRIEDLERLARLPRFVEEIDAVRHELQLDKVHLVGHSWGAAVALEYVLTAEIDGIESVVFIGPFFGTDKWIADTNELVEALSAETQEAIRAAIESGDFDSSEFQRANEEFSAKYGIRTPRDELNMEACNKKPSGDSGLYEFMWGPSEFVSNGTLLEYDRTDRLSEIGLPTLFVVGEFDEVRIDTINSYQSKVEKSRVVILPDAGHAVQLDEPELLNEELIRFFNGVEK